MPGRLQRNFIRDGLQCGKYQTPVDRFEPRPHRKHPDRIACVLCGDAGYGPTNPDWQTAAPWQLIHMLDHPYGCWLCPMRFVSGGRQAGHVMQVHGCDPYG